MWPFHHESHRKIIIKTVLVCVVIFGAIATTNYFINRPKNQLAATLSPQEIKNNYVQTLNGLKRSLENDHLSDIEARDKTEQSLFAMRVPKEMLDKHLDVVLKVRQMKDKPSSKSVVTLIDYLLKQTYIVK